MGIFDSFITDLFDDSFFNNKKSIFESYVIGNDKEAISKRLKSLTKEFGGNIKTEQTKLTRINKTWTSNDGKHKKTFTYYVKGDVNETEMKIDELQEQLDQAVKSQEFEKCAKLRDQIKQLKNKNT